AKRRTRSRDPLVGARIDFRILRAHSVVAHRRTLSVGSYATPGKVREAAALGISLDPGQTWVTAHVRGTGTRIEEVALVWDPHPALAAFL
ncbi:MAG: hypothetical protein ACXVRA_10145, partial [Gaiellaceae bacterium]